MKKLLFCAVLLFALPVFATIAPVQSAATWANTLGICSVPFTSSPTGGNLIAVWTSWTTSSANNVTVTQVTDTLGNGTGSPASFPSAVGPTIQSASNTAGQIFYAKNISGGSPDTVKVTFSSAPSSSNCVIVEISGADQYYPLDSVSAGYSTSGNSPTNLDSGAVAPANTNLLLFGGGTSDAGNPLVVASPFTSIQSHSSSPNAITEYATVTGSNTLQRATVGYNLIPPPAGNWLMQMAVFRDASWTVGGGWNPPRFAAILDATQFPGVDIGDQVNHAYAALPATGGHIIIPGKPDGGCYTFTTPIVLNTPGKYVLLEYAGAQGLITSAASPNAVYSGCLNYSPVSATSAIQLDYANNTTSVASAAHGLRNILLVNNFCGGGLYGYLGCHSAATGIQVLNVNHGIQGATMENVAVEGFSIGYLNMNFNADPVVWINPNFWFDEQGWAIGNVSVQTIHGGFFGVNNTAIGAPPTTVTGCTTGCDATSEISVYGTTFVENLGYAFDYSNNSTCCATLRLYGVHLENTDPASGGAPAHYLQGLANFFMSGGVAEDDNQSGSGTSDDLWFNAQGQFFTMRDVDLATAMFTPTIGVIKDSATTTVNVSVNIKGPTTGSPSLPCSSIVGGTSASTATVQASTLSSTSPCVWAQNSSQQFTNGVSVSGTNATMTSGAGVPTANCSIGSTYTNTRATSKSTLLYVCYPANTWTAVMVP